jgi:hypothetical protein
LSHYGESIAPGRSPDQKETMMELLALLIALIALDLLSIRFGHDSRDGFGAMPHGREPSEIDWSDSTYERELAHQTQEARQRRLAPSQFADTSLLQAPDHLPRAALAQVASRKEDPTCFPSSTRRTA